MIEQAEFEDICEEAQLWTKLQNLEQLCQEQGLLDENEASARYGTKHARFVAPSFLLCVVKLF